MHEILYFASFETKEVRLRTYWEKQQQWLHPVRLSPEQCDVTPQLHLTPVPAAEHFHEWLLSKLSDLDLSFEMSLLLYSTFQCETELKLFFWHCQTHLESIHMEGNESGCRSAKKSIWKKGKTTLQCFSLYMLLVLDVCTKASHIPLSG